MSNKDIKLLVIEKLFERGEYIKQVNDDEYRTRCPFCGDSMKNLNTGHLYIKINPNDNFPMVYNCFKCNEHGIVNQEFLSLMDIDDTNLKSAVLTLNKNADKYASQKFLDNNKTIMFDYKLPPIHRGEKTHYIEKRLGITLSDETLKDMKVITSLREFLMYNHIQTVTLPDNILWKIEKKYVGFLTFGASHILFRDITNTEEYHWIKYQITHESRQCRAFYSISSTIDVFTNDIITINLTEGIMDILSVYTNLEFNGENILNIAVCGKHYLSILEKLINMGFVGSNIHINIFADNDMQFNKNKNNVPTDLEYFQKILYKVKHVFGDINIYYNQIDKDVGVPKEKILLKKYKI